MLWGSLGAKGTEQLVNAQGMMNSDKYQAILQTQLPTTMKKDFPDADGIFSSISHHAMLHIKGTHSLKKVKVLNWPGNIPSINSIENLLAIIK